jgi:membrane-associated phospholipid phosphatase
VWLVHSILLPSTHGNSGSAIWQQKPSSRPVHESIFYLSRKTLEYRLDNNPPRAARAFVLPFVTLYDIGIACWEAKYAYWAIRPFQLDPDVKPLFATPNHPSYPAAHACASISATRMLGYLFPRDAEAFAALGERAAESRIWAGIHYRSDIVAGRQLAIAVVDKVIERAKQDGAQ